MNNEMSLNEAAKLLKKTPRQVRRYIENGRLPACGGGHGVPYRISKSAFAKFQSEATFRDRRACAGLITAESLARIAAGFEAKRKAIEAESEATAERNKAATATKKAADATKKAEKAKDKAIEDKCKSAEAECKAIEDKCEAILSERKRINEMIFPWWESTMLFKWGESGSHIATSSKQRKLWQMQLNSALRRCFPSVEKVSPEIMKWAQDCTSRLSPAEIDFIAALFVVVAYPWTGHNDTERRAISKFHNVLLTVDRNIDRYLDSALESGDIEALDGTLKKKESDSGDIEESEESIKEKEYSKFWDKLNIELGVERDKFGNNRIGTSIRSVARKMRQDRARMTTGKPSAAAACQLLGIHRYAGTRLWSSIVKALGRDGVQSLFEKMGIYQSTEVRKSLQSGLSVKASNPEKSLSITDEQRQEIARNFDVPLDKVPFDKAQAKAFVLKRIVAANLDQEDV